MWAYANFYPRPPWGGRRISNRNGNIEVEFLSTPSVGRATQSAIEKAKQRENFYPRPPWGGRRACPPRCVPSMTYFYPRPPWGGRHALFLQSCPHCKISIHALRGEGDADNPVDGSLHKDFYPRPPWGGRHGGIERIRERPRFLSTPSVGRATGIRAAGPVIQQFLSTPSVGRATCIAADVCSMVEISIHALRGEGDGGDPPVLKQK